MKKKILRKRNGEFKALREKLPFAVKLPIYALLFFVILGHLNMAFGIF